MEKLILNFYGETITINVPANLETLRKIISEQFLFFPSDVAEIIIGYKKDLNSIIIKTEEDFRNFLKEKINQINLDISEESRIYKQNYNKIENDEKALKEELENLIKEKQEIYQKGNLELIEGKQLIREIKIKIKELKEEKEEKKMNLKYIYKKYLNEITEKEKRINEIKEKLNLSKENENEKKFENENEMIDPLGIKIKKEEKKRNKKEKKQLKQMKKEEKKKKKEERKKKIIEKGEIKENEIQKEEKKPNFFEKIANDINNKLKKTNNYFNNITEKLIENSKNKNNVIHRNIICNGCGMVPIIGIRYKCASCPDFDYCENCENKFGEIHNHPFIKYTAVQFNF